MEHWQKHLTAFDAALCNMVESVTGEPCEPKNGGDHYFIEPDYRKHNEPQFILALWDAIEGRVGERLMEIRDDPERERLFVKICFYNGPCKDAAFIPKHVQK